MVVVTSGPRSGSSMCMQTLMHLGVPISAPAFIPENEKAKEFNPKGYYELNLTDGITDDRYHGRAVKLFGGQLHRTPKELISRLIYIDRDYNDAIKSFNLMRGFLSDNTSISSTEIYFANKKLIQDYVDSDTMCVKYDEVCAHPMRFVDELILYLQLQVSAEQRENAINNINK